VTDLEKFIALYKELGIEIFPEPNIHNEYGAQVLHLESHSNDLFIGYPYFCSDIYFDEDGKFIQQGFWE